MKTKVHKWTTATLLVASMLAGTACSDDSPGNGEISGADPTTTTAVATTSVADSPEEAPVPTEAVPTETPVPTASPANGDEAGPAVWSNGSEGPGRFRTDWFAKPFSFTVGAAWVPAFAGAPDNANIWLRDVAILFVLETAAGSTDALVNNLNEIEGVELTDEATVVVGEQPGVRYVVAGEYEGASIRTPTGEFTFGAPADEAYRMTVLEIDESVLVVLEVTSPGDRDVGWAATTEVRDSIAWG